MHEKLIDKNCGCEMGLNPLPGEIEIFTFSERIFLLMMVISSVN